VTAGKEGYILNLNISDNYIALYKTKDYKTEWNRYKLQVILKRRKKGSVCFICVWKVMPSKFLNVLKTNVVFILTHWE
jgi:hypothetical protein